MSYQIYYPLKKRFEVIVWSYEDLNLPKGILRKDASEIISQNYLTSFNQNYQKQNLSSFSNLFRYELLKNMEDGGSILIVFV